MCYSLYVQDYRGSTEFPSIGDYVTGEVIGGNENGYPMIRQGYYIHETGNEAIVVGSLDVYRCYPKILVKVRHIIPLTENERIQLILTKGPF